MDCRNIIVDLTYRFLFSSLRHDKVLNSSQVRSYRKESNKQYIITVGGSALLHKEIVEHLK